MKTHVIYKTASHIYGHIFEHALYGRIRKYLLQNKALITLSETCGAWTEDDLVIFSLSENIFAKINDFSELQFSNSEIENALKEISCEYKRTFSVKNIDDLRKNINKIRQEKWVDLNKSNAKKIIYEENILSCPEISFSRNRKLKHFNDIYVELSLDEKYQNERPFAMYIFSEILEILSAHLYEKYSCYQSNDYWNEWDDYTGFGFVFTFDISFDADEIREYIISQIKEQLKNENFMIDLIKYLVNTENSDKYFSWDDLQKNARFIVGDEGWRNLATKPSFAKISDNIKIECEISK